MSILDALSTLSESPTIWTMRADYWENVAVRHDRHSRFDQAERLRANVALMRARADKMIRDAAKVERDAKRAAKASGLPVTVPAKPDRAILSQAMSRPRVTGGFKTKGTKDSPTIAQAMVRGRKAEPGTDAGDSVH